MNVSGMLSLMVIYVVLPMKHIWLMGDFSDFRSVSLPLGFKQKMKGSKESPTKKTTMTLTIR